MNQTWKKFLKYISLKARGTKKRWYANVFPNAEVFLKESNRLLSKISLPLVLKMNRFTHYNLSLVRVDDEMLSIVILMQILSINSR